MKFILQNRIVKIMKQQYFTSPVFPTCRPTYMLIGEKSILNCRKCKVRRMSKMEFLLKAHREEIQEDGERQREYVERWLNEQLQRCQLRRRHQIRVDEDQRIRRRQAIGIEEIVVQMQCYCWMRNFSKSMPFGAILMKIFSSLLGNVL